MRAPGGDKRVVIGSTPARQGIKTAAVAPASWRASVQPNVRGRLPDSHRLRRPVRPGLRRHAAAELCLNPVVAHGWRRAWT